MSEPIFISEDDLAADVEALQGRSFHEEMAAATVPGAPPAEMPPAPDGPITVVLGTRVPDHTYLQIARLAEARGMKTSALARQWLMDRLAVETGHAGHQRVVSRDALLALIEQLPDAA